MGSFAENIGREVRKLHQRGLGATFWLKTTVFSDAIKVHGTELNLTANSERGELMIEDIVIKGHTGGGLASASANEDTVRIISTNNFGSSVVFAARVADIGTSMNVNMQSARELIIKESDLIKNYAYNHPVVLEVGKKLQIHNLGGIGDGDGKVDIHIKFRKLSNDANIEV